MRLSAVFTPVAYVDLLCRLVSARNFAELSAVSNMGSARLLAVNPVEPGGLSFLYFFNFMLGVLAAERAVGVELNWSLHTYFPSR